MPRERSLHVETETLPELAEYAERVGLLRLSGEINATETDLFASSLLACANGGTADLIVDLSRITFLSASGADMLIAFGEEFRRGGRRLLLVVASGQVSRLLGTLRVADHLSVHESVDTAADAYLKAIGQYGSARAAALADEVVPAAPAWASELGKVAGSLLTATTVTDVLQRTVLTSRDLIGDADLASVTLRQQDGSHHTPVSTHEEAALLDRLQYDSGEGPCVDAASLGGPPYAHSGRLGSGPEWSTFGPAAAALGISSVLSTALLTGPEAQPLTGALNLYSRNRDGFDASTRHVVFLLVGYASLALQARRSNVHAERAVSRAHKRVTDLRRALKTNTVIGQATGILMARRGLTAVDAFNVLSRASSNHQVKVAALAQTLTADPGAADHL
jgi:anti-anti-sigma factor